MQIAVIKTNEGYEQIWGSPTLDSLDGQRRAPLPIIMADSWTQPERAAFGVYIVDTTPPNGKRWTGTFVGDPPAAVFEDMPVPTDEERRAAMPPITPLQGILTLGEVEWGKVLTYRETASWQEKIIIDNASDWVRNSQNIAFFGYLLNYTDEQMDDLFIAAASVTA